MEAGRRRHLAAVHTPGLRAGTLHYSPAAGMVDTRCTPAAGVVGMPPHNLAVVELGDTPCRSRCTDTGCYSGSSAAAAAAGMGSWERVCTAEQ